jgi:DNA polymerase-3 subunit alpha
MITTLRTITTKKGAPMAFATLQDYHGSIDLTFFPKTWEALRNQVHTDGIYAFKGKIDASRGIDQASMIVDALEDINSLQTKAIQELHIQLESGLNDERQIFDLKEYLFGNSGNCAVYFHIDSEGQSFTVKANSQLTAPSSKEFIDNKRSINKCN